MRFPQIRIASLLLRLMAASVAAGISVSLFAGYSAKLEQPKTASFQIKNEFMVQVPKDTKTARLWFAVPQEDSASVVREFSVAADFPVHYYRDDWGNRVGYAEINAPGDGPLKLREQFGLTRTEIRNSIGHDCGKRDQPNPGRAKNLQLDAGKRRLLGEGSRPSEGFASRQYGVLL